MEEQTTVYPDEKNVPVLEWPLKVKCFSQVLDMIRDGFFSPNSPDEFKDIVDMLLHHDRLTNSFLFHNS